LLIFGDHDFSPLADAVELFELLPNAQLAVLPGTTHVGVTRRPSEMLALIVPFTRLPPDQAGTFQVAVDDITLRGYP